MRSSFVLVISKVAATLLLFAATQTIAEPIEDKVWLEIRSPNFIITGTKDEDRLREIARDAEVFRAAVLAVTGIEPSKYTRPVQVYLVPNRQFQQLTGHDKWAAVTARQRWGDFTMVLDSAVVRKTAAVWHEYVHTILNGQLGIDFPLWYSEGLAEYFANSRSFQGTFTLGEPSNFHLRQFYYRSLIEPHELLTSTAYANYDDDERSSFYSWSWLLVHFLQHSTRAEVPLGEGLTRYYEARRSGQGEVESFVTAFKIQPDELREKLARYGERECCDYIDLDEETLLDELDVTLRKLPRPEIALALGRIAVAFDDSELAGQWLGSAREYDDALAQALAHEAVLEAQAENFSKAGKLIDEAASISPDNPRIQIELANFLIGRHKRNAETNDHADIHAAQSALAKAWAQDKSLANIYALTGDTYLILGDKPERAVEMFEQAVTLSPTNRRFRYGLALAYSKAGDNDSAVKIAKSLTNWAHGDDEITRQAQELINEWEKSHGETIESVGDH